MNAPSPKVWLGLLCLGLTLVLTRQAAAETGAIDEAWLRGELHYQADARFVRIPRRLSLSKRAAYLHVEALQAFEQMARAARADHVRLRIVSASRSFQQQRGIWQRKWRRFRRQGLSPRETIERIMEYTAVPGSSRHHWGTDVDINAVTPAYFKRTRRGQRAYDWLRRNAARYGFAQAYGPDGPYAEEKWHWTYRPLADRLEAAWLARQAPHWFEGFAGAEIVRREVPVERWVDRYASQASRTGRRWGPGRRYLEGAFAWRANFCAAAQRPTALHKDASLWLAERPDPLSGGRVISSD